MYQTDIRKFLGYDEDYPLYKIAEDILMLLRKSRKDEKLYTDEPIEETLKRHEDTIQRWAIETFGTRIPEKNIYKEVVSGGHLNKRPKMLALLHDIESPKIRAVVCNDIERLGRGDGEDQAKIMKSFEYSNTKILTPKNGWYDLQEKYSKKMVSNKFRESEEFLEYTKEKMSDGRERSVYYGLYPHSVAPYGFIRKKLEKERGFTLVSDENESKVCKLMLDLLQNGLNFKYKIEANDTTSSICKKFGITTEQFISNNDKLNLVADETVNIIALNIGTSIIAKYLNFLGIKPRKAKYWTDNMVRKTLLSPAVHGYTSWGIRKTKMIIKDGKYIKTRPLNDNALIVKGIWEPIFSVEESEFVKSRLNSNHKNNSSKELKNPLAGLVYCELCGSKMQRRPFTTNQKKRTHKATLEDRNRIRLFLREHKGKLSLNDISRELKVSKCIIDHWFTNDNSKFSMPSEDNWNKLKELLKLNHPEFDKIIANNGKFELVPYVDTLHCQNVYCECVGSDLEIIEEKVIESLKLLLKDYKYYIKNYSSEYKKEIDSNQKSKELIQSEIETVKKQISKACDFLENGVYDENLFIERKTSLDKKLKQLYSSLEILESNPVEKKFKEKETAIPLIENTLNQYNKNLTPKQKNLLLSALIDKILYKKLKKGIKNKCNFNLKIKLKV